MRSKYFKSIVSFVLSVVVCGITLPIFIFIKDVVGLENELVLGLILLIGSLSVYGLVSISVESALKKINEKVLLLRKAHSGRDFAAEEKHEDESSGLISLSINEKK